MKSLYHILALKCDFGADTSLFRLADFLRNSIILAFAPLTDKVANLHYNIKAKMAAFVKMLYYCWGRKRFYCSLVKRTRKKMTNYYTLVFCITIFKAIFKAKSQTYTYTPKS